MKHLVLGCILFISSIGNAKLKSEKIEYKSGDNILEGAIVYDTAALKKNKKIPGVVVVHDWMGIGDYVMMRAEQLAKLGYAAFVADIYGKGNKPKDTNEAAALSSKYKNGDRKELRSRAEAAFLALKKSSIVNGDKISAMGYCFGGTVALEMARMGLALNGVISFHGGLAAVTPEDAKYIKTKLLIMHGAIDPFVPANEVAQFQKELNDAGVNYEFISYSGAVHSFTNKSSGNDISKGAAYNEQADQRSFASMKTFLKEINQ